MFCSGCGNPIEQGLNYCKTCGKRIADEVLTKQGISAETMKAVGYIGGFGFFAYIFVIGIFLRFAAQAELLIPISFFFFGALFGICFLLLHYSSGGRKTAKESSFEEPSKQQYLKPPTTAQLEEPRDLGIGSVTEHTTRTLDQVRVERR